MRKGIILGLLAVILMTTVAYAATREDRLKEREEIRKERLEQRDNIRKARQAEREAIREERLKERENIRTERLEERERVLGGRARNRGGSGGSTPRPAPVPPIWPCDGICKG